MYAGPDAASFIGVPAGDPRVPDVIGIAQVGSVHPGGTAKPAEHGGDDPQDRGVPLVIAGDGVRHSTDSSTVEITQIAPTILGPMGFDPDSPQAAVAEHAPVLPVSIR